MNRLFRSAAFIFIMLLAAGNPLLAQRVPDDRLLPPADAEPGICLPDSSFWNHQETLPQPAALLIKLPPAQMPLLKEKAQLLEVPQLETDSIHASIEGTLLDERGIPVVNAYVDCTIGGVITGRELTDFDGKYRLDSIPAGRADVIFKFQGKELRITDIALTAGGTRTVDGKMQMPGCSYGTIVIIRRICMRLPLTDPMHPGGRTTHTAEMIW